MTNLIENLIDKLFLRGLLRAGTWVKRHWVAALIILFLLWLVPPFLVAMFNVTSAIVTGLTRLAGARAAVAVGVTINRLWNWLGEKAWRQWAFAAVIGLFLPLVGLVLGAWLLVDRFKKGAEITVVPSPGPQTPPQDAQAEPSIDDVYNEINGFPV